MKSYSKSVTIILSLFVFVCIAGYLVFGNPVVLMNNQKLEKSMKSIDSKTVQFNDVIPFEWDTVYTFEPYQSIESIEKIVGFKSADIKENNINEGMVHLLFVKDEKVVASILGYGNNLGYSIDFASKERQQVTFTESAQFDVKLVDGVTTLTYAQ